MKKTKCVVELSDERRLKLIENATSKYTFIQISHLDVNLFVDILKSMKVQQYQTILSKMMSQVGKDPLSVQTLIGTKVKEYIFIMTLTKTFFNHFRCDTK